MSAVIPSELQRVGRLGKFPGRTEAIYLQWALVRAWPDVRVILWVAVVAWATNPLVFPLVLDLGRPAPLGVWLVSWGVAAVLLAYALLAERHLRTWLPPTVLTLATLAALTIGVLLDSTDTPNLLVSTAVLFLYLAPVLRFSFRSTGVVLVMTVPVTMVVAIVIADRDGTMNGAFTYQLWLLGIASVIALAMSVVIENNSRGRFIDEQVIASQRALIRRYVPPAVADRIEHGDTTVDSAQRRRVTVFFADVVGFTTLADRIDPEALAEIVNEYLGSVAQIVETHGGTLNEFAGDGVMAIFGAPDCLEPREQVVAALGAAQELQRSLPEWSQRWYPLGIDQDLQARIGINTGVVSVGTFGSAVRATYTGIGLQTNIAARIQAQCSPGSVLLSKTSWHLVSDTVRCEPRGQVEVKGVHFPIAMYEPRSD